MTKLPGQAFDTEKMYGELGIKEVERFARETGLLSGVNVNCDLGQIMNHLNRKKQESVLLEVGCGYGRIGKTLIYQAGISYFGIDLHKPFIDSFREYLDLELDKRIFHGNFLNFAFPFKEIDYVLFPWSVIGDFSSDNGQLKALSRSNELLNPNGRILIDIPSDIVNKVEGYQPGCFKIHERYDLSKIGLKFLKSHPYRTFTGRNREILELTKKIEQIKKEKKAKNKGKNCPF